LEIKEAVRAAYGDAAKRVANRDNSGCCSPPEDTTSDCCSAGETGFGLAGYSELPFDDLPDAAVMASLGCGNPTAIAALQPGERVLDLGSGGGLDVFLSAWRVGPNGFVYGLDMTDEMLELARTNQRTAGLTNVEFLKGEIEAIPLPDASVDVIISNCVINLSPDKPTVFAEAHRVLAPGGRLAISDVVALRSLSDLERADLASWAGCVTGALTAEEYLNGLRAAGFRQVAMTPVQEAGPAVVTALITATA
jgi:SAM-dependent methyltransferase